MLRSSNLTFKKRPGYTLLELLVSVLIFSGIIILAIAAFARSVGSGTHSNIVRAQVQAARSVTDQLTNDMHYIDPVDMAMSLKTTCGSNTTTFAGLRLGNTSGFGCDEAELIIKYPGATGAGDLVWRLYASQTLNSRASIYVYELRGLTICTNSSNQQVLATVTSPCTAATPPATPADLLSGTYVTDSVVSVNPVFSGSDLNSANSTSPATTPYVAIDLSLKPASDAALSCSTLAPGTCYTLKTTLIPGSA